MATKAAAAVGRSVFTRGEGTLSIPFSMHADHRQRLHKKMADAGGKGQGWFFFKGCHELPVYDTDTAWETKQESMFQWLFGVKEHGLYGAINRISGSSVLFIPRQPASYAQWYGEIKEPKWFKDTYEVDEVHYTDEMVGVLESVSDSLLVLDGTNRDSHTDYPMVEFEGIEKFKVERSNELYMAMTELRVVKDAMEIEIMQFTNNVSSEAHIKTMLEAQRNDRRMEYHSEAEFKYQSFLRGCSRVGYWCICPSELRNATLHYGHAAEPNEHKVKDGDLKLHDMGAEYHCYTADITCTFPIGGKFTPEQAVVYNAVWEAVQAVEKAIKPGVNYISMHLLAQEVMYNELRKDGLFTGSYEDSMTEGGNVIRYFFCTGLGHQLGLDVHDVGGYLPGEGKEILKDVSPYPITQNLRFGRPILESMVFTVEPGIYFGTWLMDNLKNDAKAVKFVNLERLEQLTPVGGVRIEDNVVCTATGCRVLNNVPRTIPEIEAVIAGEPWKGAFRDYSS